MPERKNFPLRLEPRLHAALEKWAADELRSVNAQIEYLLRDALRKSGRLKDAAAGEQATNGSGNHEEPPK